MNHLATPFLVMSYAAMLASVYHLSYWGMTASAGCVIVGWLVAENT